MHSLIAFILDLLFPQTCVGCRRAGEVLCGMCVRAIAPAEPMNDVVVVWSFADPRARATIHALKYRRRTGAALPCAGALSAVLLEELSERRQFGTFHEPLLVPIPLSSKRKRARGFNQSELIVRRMAAQKQFPATLACNVLERIKDTPPQARIKDKRERMRNIARAFAVPQKFYTMMHGRDIVLVDDVTTTGATLRAGRDALLVAGAREVLLCAVAH